MAAALRDFLKDKPAGAPIWGGTWAKDRRGAEVLRIDLDAASIPYSVDGPDGPEYADFHALRHSYLTLGGRSGIDLRTLQELAGHSKPELTARYSHRRLYDLAGAVEKLPNLVPTTEPNAGAIPLRLTGTESATISPSRTTSSAARVVPGVATGDIRGHQSASSCINGTVATGNDADSQTLEKTGAGGCFAPARIAFAPRVTDGI